MKTLLNSDNLLMTLTVAGCLLFGAIVTGAAVYFSSSEDAYRIECEARGGFAAVGIGGTFGCVQVVR